MALPFFISHLLRKAGSVRGSPSAAVLQELRILKADFQRLGGLVERLAARSEGVAAGHGGASFERLIGSRGGDLLRLAELAAALDSARYLSRRMGSPEFHRNASALRKAACRSIMPDGLVLEFGVGQGRSITQIAEALPARTIHGFDSFEGLPEAWRPGFGQGRFAQPPPSVPANVELVVGLFEETLPRFLARHSGAVALLHVDCDLYSSTRTVLRLLSGRIHPGTVIVFDEYFNYPGWQLHEHKAFREWVVEHGVEFEYSGAAQEGQQVMVTIKGTPMVPSA